jgi:hypothetical protein
MPRRKKSCVCGAEFQPRSEARYFPHERCPGCRKLVQAAIEEAADLAGADPFAQPVPPPDVHHLAAPMRQVVFDLESYTLSPDWGVLLVASFLIHGGAEGPVTKTIDIRDSGGGWPDVRSNDKPFVEQILQVLQGAHIVYAHNGNRFDIPWLRTSAMRYGFRFPSVKLVDPAAIAWKKYRLGRNSLDALAQFLGLEEQKMHVGPEVWKRAVFDNSAADWQILRERCESDVRVLNAIAAKVTNDVGLVDYSGSAYR